MMKTALVGVAVLGVSFLLQGCLFGCDPGNNSDRTPVTFTPSSTDATRTCASYQLKLLGDTTVAPPYTLVEVNVAAGSTLGETVPLWVDDTATTAHSSDNKISFSIQQASNLDDSSISAVSVTPNTLPTTDGELMSVELQITFGDGRVLDQVYTAPMTTEGKCGAI